MSTLRLTIELHTDDGAYEVFAASVPCPVPHPHPAAACSDLHRLAPVTRVARGLTAVLEQLARPLVQDIIAKQQGEERVPYDELPHATIKITGPVIDLHGDDIPRSGTWAYITDRYHRYEVDGRPACGEGPALDDAAERKTPGGPWCRVCVERWRAAGPDESANPPPSRE